MMENPSFYSVTPAHVRYDRNLKANEKLLYGEITALAQKDGYCFAGNAYFANLYGVAKSTISRWISHLQECGYVKVDLVKNLNGAVEMRRIIVFETCQGVLTKNAMVLTKSSIGYTQKEQGGIDEKSKGNNTRVNNTSNNNITPTPFSEYAKDDVDLLNALLDFEKMRKGIKNGAMNEKAKTLLLSALDKLTSDNKTKIAILEQSIFNNWKSVYALKGDENERFQRNCKEDTSGTKLKGGLDL